MKSNALRRSDPLHRRKPASYVNDNVSLTVEDSAAIHRVRIAQKAEAASQLPGEHIGPDLADFAEAHCIGQSIFA